MGIMNRLINLKTYCQERQKKGVEGVENSYLP